MSKLSFCKYDGAGNDFILVDIRSAAFDLTTEQIAHLCHRRFGIGADGLMTLGTAAPADNADFVMTYYNSDGRVGSMCGNGGRCISAFAYSMGLGSVDSATGHRCFNFMAFDGRHHSEMLLYDDKTQVGLVRLSMGDVACDSIARIRVPEMADGWFLDTGSPHFVQRVDGLADYDVVGHGRAIRNLIDQFPQGTNVDFIEDKPDGTLFVRTYERGVEDETWACGTGVTAAAIVSGNHSITTRGGDFKVDFDCTGKAYVNLRLTGPVSFNFSGEVMI